MQSKITHEPSSTERWKESVRREWTETDKVAAWRKWYPQFVEWTRAATETIVEAAQVKPGMRVLDVASGTGEPALTLAGAVAPTGQVAGIDLVLDMLTFAQRNARQRGLTNIAFQQAEAEALPFAPQSFDMVTCRFGLMFFANVAQALREIHRVLKPGGRAVFIAWGPAEQNPIFTSTTGILAKYVEVPAPEPGAPDAYRFAQAGTLSAALQEAGFRQVQEEFRTLLWPWPGSVEQAWEGSSELRGPQFCRLIERVAPEIREQVVSEILAAIRQYYDGKQVNFPAIIILASGMR